MPSCDGCGTEMKEISRKIIKGEASTGRPHFKAVYACEDKNCDQKGTPKGFLDDGLMFIPLPDK